jgi:hypothetical protein
MGASGRLRRGDRPGDRGGGVLDGTRTICGAWGNVSIVTAGIVERPGRRLRHHRRRRQRRRSIRTGNLAGTGE